MAQTVIGLFDNASEAQEAVQALVDKGFSRSNIDVSSSVANTGTGNLTTGSNLDADLDINRNLDSVSGSNYSSSSSVNRDYDNDKEESGISKFFKNLLKQQNYEYRYNS